MARIESTERISNFHSELKKINWSDKKTAMDILYDQVNILVQAELDYYYKRRRFKRKLSTFLKIVIWVTASIGILFPLISNTGVVSNKANLSSWGYVVLALAGALYTADRLFTGSSGHMRYVSAQLKLEAKLTSFRLQWIKKSVHLSSEKQGIPSEELMNDLIVFVNEFYQIILEETQEWKGELTEAFNEISRKLNK